MEPKTLDEQVEKLWAGLKKAWVQADDVIEQKGGVAYRLSCEVFDVIINEIEPFRWNFRVMTAAGVTPFTTTIELDNENSRRPRDWQHNDAKREAEMLIAKIIFGGLQVYGAYAKADVKEIRFKQFFMNDLGTKYGLTEAGELYSYDTRTETWKPHSMKRADIIKPSE